ncbi:MAG: aminoacetone oxidase family FAD-binding enzyme [Terracidiphilus sp.]|jgi:predicted flavoprotein YhiN
MATAPRQFDVIVLGAGAAGLLCAATAGLRGRCVALLEHNGQAGRKILISGGGRCNFTNLHCGPGNFISENPHFAKSALALYEPRHFIELVERYGIRWHEKTLGQLFCDGPARAILDMLLAECERGGVEVVLNARGIQVEGGGGGGFRVMCSAGEFAAGALVVATGGLSIPKLGATGLGYELARQFGLGVVEPRPALVPLVLGGDEAGWTELAGVAAEVVAWTEPAAEKGHHSSNISEKYASGAKAHVHSADSIIGVETPTCQSRPATRTSLSGSRGGAVGGVHFREKMLVTHRGVSGPAVLQASSYWRQGDELVVDFAPDQAGGAGILGPLILTGARRDLAALKQALREALPQRLAGFLAEAGAPAGWGNAALEACERRLHRWKLHPVGTEGFEKAEVTAGGVDTAGLQARTMEAWTVPGLFFIGEAVDVTGQLGGFNFQWAWASGVAAGRAV